MFKQKDREREEGERLDQLNQLKRYPRESDFSLHAKFSVSFSFSC